MSQHCRLLWVTEAARRLFGWTPEAAGGDPFAGTIPEEREAIRELHERIASGETVRLAAPVVTPEGERRYGKWAVSRRRGRIYTRFLWFIDRECRLRNRLES